MSRLSYLFLSYLSTISASDADRAIDLWEHTLIDSGLYEKYKFINPSCLVHEDWLDVLSKKWNKRMWLNYKLWLKVILTLEAKEAGLPEFYLPQEG